MELCILDVEAVHEEIILNSENKVAAEKALEDLEEMLANVDLGIETSFQNINGTYVTTENNSKWYKEEYGYIFSKIVIVEL